MVEKQNSEDQVLSPTVIKLGVVSFFADVASEMLYPITPIFLTSVLGASMASLGLIEGIAEAIASLLKTYSGSWSDSISKRKPFVLIGYLFAALAKPLIGFSQIWIHVLGARSLDRVGKGIRSAPRDALIADSAGDQNLGAAFGWHRAMDTAGAAVGPLIAIWFLSLNPDKLRPLYFWALIPGLLSVLVVLSLRERPTAKSQNQKKFVNPFTSWKLTTSEFKKYIFGWGIFSLTNSSDVFLLMKCKAFGFSTQAVILLYCLYNLIYALTSPYFGKLSDRMDRRKILITGLIIFSLVYLGFSFAAHAWQFWALFIIYGLYMGATDGVGKALAVDLATPQLKATCIGMLGTVTGLCTIIASFSAGLIWDHYGSASTFIFGALGALIAALFIKFF